MALCSIEIGRYTPSAILVLKVAAVFEVRVEEVFVLEENDWK